jgi:cytoskeletal protein CcmA (bactofilin family)
MLWRTRQANAFSEVVMALFGGKNDERSGRSEEPREEARPLMTPDTRPSEPTDLQAHLGKGSRIEGVLSFQGSVRIDGHVEGQIEAKDTVIVGDSATVVAQITAGSVIIKGNVTGDVTGSKRVELRSPGRLLGNIVTPSLVIQDGVVFEGHCSMAGADIRADKSDRERDKKIAIFPKDAAPVPNRVEAVK